MEMFAAHLRTQPLQTGQHKNVFSLKNIFFLTVQWKHMSSVSKNYVHIKKKKGIELELDGEQDNYVNWQEYRIQMKTINHSHSGHYQHQRGHKDAFLRA